MQRGSMDPAGCFAKALAMFFSLALHQSHRARRRLGLRAIRGQAATRFLRVSNAPFAHPIWQALRQAVAGGVQ